MDEGKYETFRLRHGTNVREFKDVTVRKFQPYSVLSEDRKSKIGLQPEERWELTGTEFKVEVAPNDPTGGTKIVEVEVTVGFDPANVV